MRSFSYDSMGTNFAITLWDALSDADFAELEQTIREQSQEFERTYSRFIKTSLIRQLTEKRGTVEVPEDLTTMLRLYEQLFDLTNGACNPLVGFALSDMGYDAEYSLKPKEHIRPVPNFHEALSIIDDTHIELRDSVLIDLGALGKGYFVDKIATELKNRGFKKFLVNGSGDISYSGNGDPIKAGLEDPGNPKNVIGTIEFTEGALCASASNRRRWGKFHHTIDPHSLTSPEEVIATWVLAENAALADGLATCLFLVPPEQLQAKLQFEYCILNKEYNVKRSSGFTAELF